jgi:2-haloacid dehalogenase
MTPMTISAPPIASPAPAGRATHVVFDLGNVLIEWDPRHLYRQFFEGDEELMEHFLANVCTPEWNIEQDRGRPWDEAVAGLIARFPECSELIRAFYERWDEMVPGPVAGMPELLHELHERGTPLTCLTNCSVDTFERVCRRFDFMGLFAGVLVSGRVGLLKPDPEIYRRLLSGQGLNAADTLFIDDSPANVEGARAVGMHAVPFHGAGRLRADLAAHGLL